MQIDLSDAILNGTSDSIDFMEVFIPKFHVRVHQENFIIDVIRACKSNRFEEIDFNDENQDQDSFCSNVLEFNLIKIVNNILSWYAVDNLL